MNGLARILFLLALLLSPALFARNAPNAPPRSVSSSRQFVVYGEDARRRGALCHLAERRKRDLLRLLGLGNDWQSPIVLDAQTPWAARPGEETARLLVNQTEAGLKFQLALRVDAESDPAEIEREILRALLLEKMHRGQASLAPGSALVQPPDWLLEGTLALASDRDHALIGQTLRSAPAGRIWSLAEFLRQARDRLDSPSRRFYRACSGALLLSLAESPQGRERLSRYLADRPDSSPEEMGELQKHFPHLGATREEMEQTWRAALERLAASDRFRLLDVAETERELAAILQVKVPAANGTIVYALEEYPRFRRDRSARPDLARLTSELVLFSGRASPLHHGVIEEYQRIAARLARGKAPRARQLAELRATREQLGRRREEIADYLNWHEATQPTARSETFREYLRVAHRAAAPRPRRRDRISVYLDALETQF